MPLARSLGVYQNGGYATHVLATHVKHLIDIEGVDPSLAATYACSGVTVYSAINKLMPMDPDEAIVLVGAGGLGLNAIAILKALGHRRICIVDIDREQAGTRRSSRARPTRCWPRAEDTTQAHHRGLRRPGAGIVDLVNGTQTARFAFDALRKGGKLVQVGLFGGEMNIPLPLMPIRALTIQGSYVGDVKELRALIDIAKKGRSPASRWS